MVKPGRKISFEHEITDSLLAIDGNSVANGSPFHAVLTFDTFLKFVKRYFVSSLQRTITESFIYDIIIMLFTSFIITHFRFIYYRYKVVDPPPSLRTLL